ncbi:uncharacterized protein Z519_05845 [Cladophialophora bantiana CBS 173.52]|uniref:Nucleoside phosphorylase domain-containing protein n=1 Tax=Cladophialophora bantiana (strain ATCC 10958 / CBS 173.52 / CDC B-1940 / NIH 8579) TaxID=1442370 RepID=A0A0D2HQW0_CLAB1|nr:uncharacterized protein Z519_05845 [Cladophialophora bantiana CBS 173.52]KIW93240.1 hypothetical protein Z519_05845 [Cladophialophora bantiana CBS 173.52]
MAGEELDDLDMVDIAPDILIAIAHLATDEFAGQHGLIGFETEGSGICDFFPTLVIKGVCDYADSHKNKTWQTYATATAAAATKAFLKEWRPKAE